eukprot:scaffold46035_cov54-Attheya_sp.AAC.1
MKGLVWRVFILLYYASTKISALPTGSVGCFEGMPAVDGIHISRTTTQSDQQKGLEDGGMQLSIDGVPLISGDPFHLTVGGVYNLSLTTDPADNTAILGFMFRLGNKNNIDTSKFISPGDIGGGIPTFPGVCPPTVGAVSHSFNDPKFEATAILTVDEVDNYHLDVTVVTRNCGPISQLPTKSCSDETSTFFYTGYALRVEPPKLAIDPSAKKCWSSSSEITINEFLSIHDDDSITTLANNAERIYVICPNTELLIGTQLLNNQGSVSLFVGGEFQIGVFLPGLHIKCGESGSSKNNCTLSGGQEQITSLGSTDLLHELYPILMPDLPFFPTELPPGFQLDTSGLTIEGMTFTNFSMLPETEGGDGLRHSPLHLISPGGNIMVRDCIFHHGNLDHPAGSAIELAFQENLWSGNGVYLDVTVKDCEFHDNAFHHSVISSIASCIIPDVCISEQDPNPSEPVFQIEIEGCLLKDNIARSVMLLQSSKGSVTDSCLIDNTGQSKSLIETYDSLDIKFERISEKGTEYMDEFYS